MIRLKLAQVGLKYVSRSAQGWEGDSLPAAQRQPATPDDVLSIADVSKGSDCPVRMDSLWIPFVLPLCFLGVRLVFPLGFR